ncbi:uncharacterized protein H6S33_001443 [Morchella sextelata]|uniref:uncharacterized protein n=1 Tax=Morchella sextelata TaxID=1174677 RepID=UPI001D050964|nr:uncharacterized protein H6S33_001443 [Morchella sextelata]KAH0609215.1 hypothetical protein H6S33_001443 [Morchella sextelata]
MLRPEHSPPIQHMQSRQRAEGKNRNLSLYKSSTADGSRSCRYLSKSHSDLLHHRLSPALGGGGAADLVLQAAAEAATVQATVQALAEVDCVGRVCGSRQSSPGASKGTDGAPGRVGPSWSKQICPRLSWGKQRAPVANTAILELAELSWGEQCSPGRALLLIQLWGERRMAESGSWPITRWSLTPYLQRNEFMEHSPIFEPFKVDWMHDFERDLPGITFDTYQDDGDDGECSDICSTIWLAYILRRFQDDGDDCLALPGTNSHIGRYLDHQWSRSSQKTAGNGDSEVCYLSHGETALYAASGRESAVTLLRTLPLAEESPEPTCPLRYNFYSVKRQIHAISECSNGPGKVKPYSFALLR